MFEVTFQSKSVDRDISDTYFNKMCQRIKAMNYSGSKYYIDFYDVIPSGDKYRRALKLENEI